MKNQNNQLSKLWFLQATETLCHLSFTDIKKQFCNIWFFYKNESCVNCGKETATTLTWLMRVNYGFWAELISLANSNQKAHTNFKRCVKKTGQVITYKKWRHFISMNFNEKSTLRSRRRRNREQELYNYKIRDIFTLNDGSLVGSIEQYYIFERSSYDSRTGLTSTIYYYYYDDIIAFKIGNDKAFDWQKKINKSQITAISKRIHFIDKNSLLLNYWVRNSITHLTIRKMHLQSQQAIH